VEGNTQALLRENQRLRQEYSQLQREHQELEHQKDELSKRVEILAEEVAWFRRRMFGRSSEALSEEEQRQMRLFDEAEATVVQGELDEEPAELIRVPEHNRRQSRRQKLPEAFPRREVLVDIPEDEKRCGCGAELVRIGEETSEKLDVIPPRFEVIRTVRPKYACHACEGSGDEEKPAVRIAPMPPALIDKGIATAGLLAFIVTAKFCDSLPLYRQEKQFARIGVKLSRKTMADWIIRVAEACALLMRIFLMRLRSGPLLQMDETTVQVMDEPGRENTTKSFMWVSRGGPPEAPVIFYRYSPSRGSQVAKEHLDSYSGYVQTDGYDAYDVACEGREDLVHVGCWAHVRRKFFEAKTKKTGSAEEALSRIAKLYRAEDLREHYADSQQFAAARRAEVEPILEDFKKWLQKKMQQVPPGTLLGKAVAYADDQWPKLVRYLDHPAMTPDTNACENAIRPFVLGRKNWLFSGSPRGAAASATLFSIIETARANSLEPYWYLRRLFEGLPTAVTEEDYLRLAPFPALTR
jgi:transposase